MIHKKYIRHMDAMWLSKKEIPVGVIWLLEYCESEAKARGKKFGYWVNITDPNSNDGAERPISCMNLKDTDDPSKEVESDLIRGFEIGMLHMKNCVQASLDKTDWRLQ